MHERRKLPKGSPQEEMEAARRELEIVSQSRKASKTKGNIYWYICLVNEFHKRCSRIFQRIKTWQSIASFEKFMPKLKFTSLFFFIMHIIMLMHAQFRFLIKADWSIMAVIQYVLEDLEKSANSFQFQKISVWIA